MTIPTTAGWTGGRLLVECLVAARVPLMTCVPGESFLPVLDALYDLGTRDDVPRLITTRHEAAAANMAEAAGKLTGRAAVCFVTRGPGATHASIALHTAYQDGTPMVLVVGQVARAHLGRQAFQEMDYSLVFGSSAKSVVQIHDPDSIPEYVARAVQVAHSGRPGPVVLVLPEDVLGETTMSRPRSAPLPDGPATSAADLEALQGLLASARRPVMVVGGPGWTASVGEDVRRFARPPRSLWPPRSAGRTRWTTGARPTRAISAWVAVHGCAAGSTRPICSLPSGRVSTTPPPTGSHSWTEGTAGRSSSSLRTRWSWRARRWRDSASTRVWPMRRPSSRTGQHRRRGNRAAGAPSCGPSTCRSGPARPRHPSPTWRASSRMSGPCCPTTPS